MNIPRGLPTRTAGIQRGFGLKGEERAIAIAPKTEGMGSGVNGGELLFLALATCYSNDVYREAAKRRVGVTIRPVAAREDVAELVRHADKIAEVHRALRCPTPIELDGYEIAEA